MCAHQHVYLHIYIRPITHKHTLLHFGLLSSLPMSTIRSLGETRFMACLPCSLLLFSCLNVSELNEDPSKKPELPCVGASEGKKKKKREGLFKDTIMHGFAVQVKLAPTSQTYEWVDWRRCAFFSPREKDVTVEPRNAVGAESLPDPGGGWIPGLLPQKLSRQLHLPMWQ